MDEKKKGLVLIIGGIVLFILYKYLIQLIYLIPFIGYIPFLYVLIRYFLPIGMVIFGIVKLLEFKHIHQKLPREDLPSIESLDRESKILKGGEIMAQYKCVPAPTEIVIDKKGSYDTAVRSFADLINQEATGGWKFHSMENIAVTQKPGCLGSIIGKKATSIYFNMLIFSKE